MTSADDKGSENERIYNKSNPFYVDTFQTPKSSLPPKLSPFLQRIAIRVAKLFGYYDLPIQALGVTRAMYQLCARQLEANREFFIDGKEI